MSFVNNISARKAERWFFALMVSAHLWPVLSVQFFPTLDGPSHVYNARIIAELLFNSGSSLDSFYALNPTAVPNMTGHVFLALLQALLPGWIAEKVLQALIIAAIPVGFRYFLKMTGAKSLVAVYLIFPFTYSFFFFYGFYNFCLSLALLFFAAGATEHFRRKPSQVWAPAVMVLFGLILYFSHLLTFAVFCVYTAVRAFTSLRTRGLCAGERRNELLLFCLAVLPGLVFTAVFLIRQDAGTGEMQFLTFSETAVLYKEMAPAKGVLYGKESKYTQWIFYALIFMLSGALYHQFRRRPGKEEHAGIFGWLFLGFSVLSFLVPDQGLLSGGILTSRMVLFTLVFLIAFTAKFRIHPAAQGVILVVVTYVNVACLLIYADAAQREQALIREISLTAREIKEGAVVLPLKETDFWIREHYSGYLGCEKPLFLLDNYEAELGYFPVKLTARGRAVQRAAYEDWDAFRRSGVFERQLANQSDYIFALTDSEKDSVAFRLENVPEFREIRSHRAMGVFLFAPAE